MIVLGSQKKASFSAIRYTESTSKNQEPFLAGLLILSNHQLRILGPGYIAGQRPARAVWESGFTKWNLGKDAAQWWRVGTTCIGPSICEEEETLN